MMQNDGSIAGVLGLRLISNPALVIDTGKRSWARVRSHGRALRRLKRGFRQNIDVVWAPDPNFYRTADTIYAHPARLAELRRAIETAPK